MEKRARGLDRARWRGLSEVTAAGFRKPALQLPSEEDRFYQVRTAGVRGRTEQGRKRRVGGWDRARWHGVGEVAEGRLQKAGPTTAAPTTAVTGLKASLL